MSVYPKVRDSVRTLLDFVSQKTCESLVYASREGTIELTEEQVEKISNLIENSILESALTGWNEIEGLIADIDETISESVSNPKG